VLFVQDLLDDAEGLNEAPALAPEFVLVVFADVREARRDAVGELSRARA
jgi:hypothetical protein